MGDITALALALIAGVAVGAFAIWYLRRQAEAEARAHLDALAASVSKLTHDIRGALSPAMLMAERLERHDDPAVRQAAETISKAMDRAATICRDNSAAAKRTAAEG